MASELGAVSPHLDDLALSCGRLLGGRPDGSMVTVFAGGPASVDPVTGWEALSGHFEAGADIVSARRREDADAARMLGWGYRHLDHWDHQYRHRVYGYQGPHGDELVGRIAAELEALVTQSAFRTWLVPLGIGHPDHEIAAAAWLTVAARLSDREWLVYEELPYAIYDSRQVKAAKGRLADRGFDLEPFGEIGSTGSGPSKEDVVACYRSQLGPLGDGVTAAMAAPERIWRLHSRD